MARKMKDSGIEWIGEIPEGWETCLYKYCCSVQPGYPFDSAKFSNSSTDGFPLIRIRDITSGEIQTYYTGEYSPNYIVTAGDLLVGMDGDFNVRWWNNDAALLNQRCCRVTEKDSVLRRFLYYVLPFTLQHINTLTYATTVKHLANGDILNSFIAFPSLPAQQNIVHYLDTVCSEIDAMLSKTRSSIEEYKKLKQAVITQAVTKGVRGERVMKDSGVECIGKIPTTYSICKLKYLLKNPLKYGANESGIPYSDSLPRYIRITDITPDGNLKCTGKLSLSEESAKDYILEDGDILFARSGATVGKTFIYYQSYGRSAYAGYLIKASLNNKVSPKFVYYYTCSSLYEIWKNSIFIQSTIQNIGADRYANLPVPVPKTLQEQEEIADYLDAKCAEIDKLIAKKEQLVKELESYKKSLIYEVVTGKREV